MTGFSADVLVVGSGLGATALAKRLSEAGKTVLLIPGIGRTRSAHVDGGLVDDGVVESAFGSGAPLGAVVDVRQELRFVPGHRFVPERPEVISPGYMYRRDALEMWALERATAAGAVFLDDFVEGKALPNADGTMTLTSERDERTIHANVIALCEGADPRIPLRVKLRPDYGPENQLHFARVFLHGPSEPILRQGTWRASWGMPVYLAIIPQEDGVIVSVVARIENVMRGNRSAKDALDELLSSGEFESLGIQGTPTAAGMELVPLRSNRRHITFVNDHLIMGIDASGIIDPRRTDRADVTILGGITFANVLLGSSGAPLGWDTAARTFVQRHLPPVRAYHDDRETGFLEDTSPGKVDAITARLARILRREN